MFRKILYPTDFSKPARVALQYVNKLREAGAEEVVLLHVYDERNIDLYWEIEASYKEKPPERVKHDIIKRMLEKSYTKLEEIEEGLKEVGLKTQLVVIEGIPWKGIVKVAEDLDVSLIVMGSHGERGFLEKLIGSTTERVLRESNVPVLVVRPQKGQGGGGDEGGN